MTIEEKRIKFLENEIDQRNRILQKIADILQKPAANQRMMQIANPARQCLNLIKLLYER